MWRYRVESHASTSWGTKRQSQQQLLDIIGALSNSSFKSKCNDKTLDLLFTNAHPL